MDQKDWKKHAQSNKMHHVSFKFALNGLKKAFYTQPNFRFHTLALFLITAVSFILRNFITPFDFALLLAVASLVFTAELLNTAIEYLGDAISKGKYNKNVGLAKDIASSAVLVSSIFAVIVGIIILLPAIINYISN